MERTIWEHIQHWQTQPAWQQLIAETQSGYLHDVRYFAAWLTQEYSDLSLEALTIKEVQGYAGFLAEADLAPATIRRHLASLAVFFVAIRPRVRNPFHDWTARQSLGQIPVTLTRREWEAVRRAASALVSQDQGKRLALTALLRYTALAVPDLVGLTGNHIRLDMTIPFLAVAPRSHRSAQRIPIVTSPYWRGICKRVCFKRSALSNRRAGRIPGKGGQRDPSSLDNVVR